jgi:hypothetical protein
MCDVVFYLARDRHGRNECSAECLDSRFADLVTVNDDRLGVW